MHHHYDEDHLAFIKQRVESMKIALFKADIHSVLQLPSNVVQVLKVEDDGTLFFISSCSGEYVKMIESSFYAYLDFYKKGSGCPLKIGGSATIVEYDPEFSPGLVSYSTNLAGRLVLIKMKITHAECFEYRPEYVGSWMDKFKKAFHHLFLSTPHRTYNFS